MSEDDIGAKVAALRQAATYPEGAGRVEVIETHISWVFLTERYAYKLKKPVRYPYLDFRTIDARHVDSLEEVRLNRRLAPSVYLGVVPLNRRDGQIALGPGGRPIDWLVHMRRLPRARMLDQLIKGRALDVEGIRKVGRLLARFYRDASPVEMAPGEYRARFSDDIDESERELTAPAFGLPAQRITRVCAQQRQFLEQARALFTQRIVERRVVEGHGDLRPQHVCLTPEPAIIDCLEFKRDFRLQDAADELAYLAAECERLGADWADGHLFAEYAALTDDTVPPALVEFYKSFRALLRAKIAIWHNRDDSVDAPDHWVQRALEYIALAERHAAFGVGQ